MCEECGNMLGILEPVATEDNLEGGREFKSSRVREFESSREREGYWVREGMEEERWRSTINKHTSLVLFSSTCSAPPVRVSHGRQVK
jgi:hypothetical protein